MSQFSLLTGREELFPLCEEMAGQLYDYLSKKSVHYKGERVRWYDRTRQLTRSCYDLRITVAVVNPQKYPVGYSIACLYDKGKRGVIEDLYVREQYRRVGVGNKIMCDVLTWLENVKAQQINVSYGNESVLKFCEKYNFYPKEYSLFKK